MKRGKRMSIGWFEGRIISVIVEEIGVAGFGGGNYRNLKEMGLQRSNCRSLFCLFTNDVAFKIIIWSKFNSDISQIKWF
jgi:hypothetical protein